MGLNRYYTPSLPPSGQVDLPDDELHHAFHVRREVAGNRCVVFDGNGNEADCVIQVATKKLVRLDVVTFRFAPKELSAKVHLGIAMPKGDRQRMVIEKAVELGVQRITPLICERSSWTAKDNTQEKWHRFVIEACKQCERNRLMAISDPTHFGKWIAETNNLDSSTINNNYLLHPDSINGHSSLGLQDFVRQHLESPGQKSIRFGIGPEGGFSTQEVEFADQHGWKLLNLGPRILRVETAVATVASVSNCL